MSLNYAPINGTDGFGINADYAELVDELDNNFSNLPLVYMILKKLKEHFYIKKEEINEVVLTDFLEHEGGSDELNDYFSDNRILEDRCIVDQIEDMYRIGEEREPPDYVQVDNLDDNIMNGIVEKIEGDVGLNIQKVMSDLRELRGYSRDIFKQYVEMKEKLRTKLLDLTKRVNALEAIQNTFPDFENDDREMLSCIVDKYIQRADFKQLVSEYIPLKMKAYVMLGINRLSGVRNVARGECRICFSETSDLYAIADCGHTFCKNCIENIRRCALCRKVIHKKVKLYL